MRQSRSSPCAREFCSRRSSHRSEEAAGGHHCEGGGLPIGQVGRSHQTHTTTLKRAHSEKEARARFQSAASACAVALGDPEFRGWLAAAGAEFAMHRAGHLAGAVVLEVLSPSLRTPQISR